MQYSKNGERKILAESKEILTNLKYGRIAQLEPLFDILEKDFKSFLSNIDSNTVLVPTPKSSPLVDKATWPALKIANKLLEKGYGREVKPILNRIKAVPKAALQGNADERPLWTKHFETIKCDNIQHSINPITKIAIVDDVITQGRTTVACYKRLKEKFPDAEIFIFTPFRTISFDKISTVIFPAESTIKYYDSGKTYTEHLHK